jgi:hypothetical protein
MFEPSEFQVIEIKKCLGGDTRTAAELWKLVTTFEEQDELYRTLRAMVKLNHLKKTEAGYSQDDTLEPIPFDDYLVKKATLEEVITPTKPKEIHVAKVISQEPEPEPEPPVVHHSHSLLGQLLNVHPIQTPVNIGRVHRSSDEPKEEPVKEPVKVVKEPFVDPFQGKPNKPSSLPKPVAPVKEADNKMIRQVKRVNRVNEALAKQEDNTLFGFISVKHTREAEIAYILYRLRQVRPVFFRELILFTGCDRVRLGIILKRLIADDYAQLVLTKQGEKQYRWKFSYCYPFQVRRYQDKRLIQPQTHQYLRKMEQDKDFEPFPIRQPPVVNIEARPEKFHSPVGDLKRTQRIGRVAYFFYSKRSGLAYHSREIIARLHLQVNEASTLLNKLVVRHYLDLEVIDGVRYYSWSNQFSYPFATYDDRDAVLFSQALSLIEEKNPEVAKVDNQIQELEAQLKRLEQKREMLQSA